MATDSLIVDAIGDVNVQLAFDGVQAETSKRSRARYLATSTTARPSAGPINLAGDLRDRADLRTIGDVLACCGRDIFHFRLFFHAFQHMPPLRRSDLIHG